VLFERFAQANSRNTFRADARVMFRTLSIGKFSRESFFGLDFGNLVARF
jgi:hypothetical protein